MTRADRRHDQAAANQEAARAGRGEEEVPLQSGDIVLRKNPSPSKLHGHLGPYKVLTVENHYAVTIVPLLGGQERVVHADQLIQVSTTWEEEDLAALQAGDAEEWYAERVVSGNADGTLTIKWIGSDALCDEVCQVKIVLVYKHLSVYNINT